MFLSFALKSAHLSAKMKVKFEKYLVAAAEEYIQQLQLTTLPVLRMLPCSKSPSVCGDLQKRHQGQHLGLSSTG